MNLQEIREMHDLLWCTKSVFDGFLAQKKWPKEDKEKLMKPLKDVLTYLNDEDIENREIERKNRLQNYVLIVRCINCKRCVKSSKFPPHTGWCENLKKEVKMDWYCADGKDD